MFARDEAVPEPLPPSPDDHLRARVVAAEHALLARYAATAEAYPELAEDLAGFADRHQRHVDAVQATAPPPTADAGDGTPAAATAEPAPAPPTAGGPPVPADADAAVHALRDAESVAAAERLDDCLDAHDSGLAQVLAGVAACEAGHDALLDRIGRDGP